MCTVCSDISSKSLQQSDGAGSIRCLSKGCVTKAYTTDAISKLNFILINGVVGYVRRHPQYSDQCLTCDPAHSQLLIVTRHIWQIIILNNLLPWWWLTLMASDAPSSCPALWLEAVLPLCPLKVLGIRDVHYRFNLLFNPFNQPRGSRRERGHSRSAELHYGRRQTYVLLLVHVMKA